MFVVDIVNGTKVYSKVCSSCRQDTDYYQLEDEYYNFIYLSDCCNAECWGGMLNKVADNIILFRNLVSEINISKYDQTEYVSVVNSIYYHIFIDQEEE